MEFCFLLVFSDILYDANSRGFSNMASGGIPNMESFPNTETFLYGEIEAQQEKNDVESKTKVAQNKKNFPSSNMEIFPNLKSF